MEFLRVIFLRIVTLGGNNLIALDADEFVDGLRIGAFAAEIYLCPFPLVELCPRKNHRAEIYESRIQEVNR